MKVQASCALKEIADLLEIHYTMVRKTIKSFEGK